MSQAPPHARGSTPARRLNDLHQAGSPARAGIDRRRSTRSPGCPEAPPHARGSDPLSPRPTSSRAWAPPHARGSTRVRGQHDRTSHGSPARAGIDPSTTPPHHAACVGSPARAGIGPGDPHQTICCGSAPPHARGSTRVLRGLCGATGGLPRTRGDRPPDSITLGSMEKWLPPHARGSTHAGARCHRRAAGSPARAGIDPARRARRSPTTRLPRTRGDRPQPEALTTSIRPAPPHARGSTLQDKPERVLPEGSPARAGIDPDGPSRRRRPRWLPRTRGDRPEHWLWTGCMRAAPPHARGSTPCRGEPRGAADGSPARAGIDPSPHGPRRGTTRLPRTRGDRPEPLVLFWWPMKAPPHARGSTGASVRDNVWASGSPARAGIDPCGPASGPASARLPRTRGDRPGVRPRAPRVALAPPHARGSTRRDADVLALSAGSPARAGIDPGRPSTRPA